MYSDYNYSDAHVKIGRLTTVEPDVIRDAINDKITSKNTHFYQNYPGLNPAHIFCRPLTKSELHPPSGTAFHGPNGNDMALCLNIDFEWYTPGLPDILANCATKTQYPRELVTCQVRSVVHEKSYILVSSKAAENGTPRHSVMDIKDHFAFLALVRYYYPEAVVNNDPERTDLDELPKLQIVIFAHFLLVDLGASCISNEALSFFEKGVKTNKIRQQRRLSSGKYGRDLKTKFTITLEGVEYAIQFKLIDTLGLYGNATYKAACEIAGITLNVKDKMQAYIENMHLAYYAEPDDFDEYAHQDTYTSDIIYNHNRLMTKVCIEIGIQRQFDKLTMGSTVNGLFEQRLRDITGLHKLTKKRGKKKKSKVNLIVPLDEVVTDESTRSENDPLKGLTECASADYLKNMINTKAHLLAKCNGGRCRNAQPTTSALKNKVLVDIDISGAYTGAMQRLSYCLGRPVIIAFNNNQCKLKNFLKYHRKDLSPGQWYMRISTSELLKYPQHLFLSWFDLQQDTRTFKQDSESYDITGDAALNV